MSVSFVHWTDADGAVHRAGTLTTIGPGLQRFTYDPAWLRGPGFALGEGLPVGNGPLLPPGGASEFGLFADAGPDGWGRRVLARKLTPAPRSGTDFLLAAADATRQGALRFSTDPDGNLLSDGSAAPLTSLDALYEEVRAFQADPDSPGAFSRLLRAGTSQGGFRPKAAVIDADGALWIAKFPAETDTWDIETGEAAALAVAERAGLTTPDFRHVRVDADRAILLVKRFDRTRTGRLGYQSLRTAARLGPDDVLDYQLAASVSGFLAGSVGIRATLEAAALNIAVNNGDDHARNTGFLQDGRGQWAPAPVFDIVPFPGPTSGTPLAPGDPNRSLQRLRTLDWGVPRGTVDEVVDRVEEAAGHLYAIAVERFGLDPEAAERAERVRRTSASGLSASA